VEEKVVEGGNSEDESDVFVRSYWEGSVRRGLV
jgi:hypothetical protein